MVKQVDCVFRVRYEQKGGHVHCAVFTAASRDHTFAKMGDLVVSENEFTAFSLAFSGAEFLPRVERADRG